MSYLKAGSSFFRVALYSCAVFCFFFGWRGSGYGGTTPSFTWTIDAVYPVQEESIETSEAESTRNTIFREIVTNLSTGGTGASLEKFRSKNGDVYRIKSKSGMPLDDFRRQFHSEIAKKISFLSGPVRMSISGKVPAAGSLTVVVDSNPSTGYHWVADSSSGAEVLFKKTTFNRRSFRRGTVQSQQLIFTSNQVNGDRELKAISCNLHLALRIQGKVQPMLIQGEKSLPELLSILNKTKNSSIPLSRD